MQLRSLQPTDTIRIADYAFVKDAIFAELLLRGRELRLYERINGALQAELVRPKVLVYLDATNAVLLQRIARRGRAYEVAIDEHYLNELRDAYSRRVSAMGAKAPIYIDTSTLNLASESQLDAIFHRVQAAIGLDEISLTPTIPQK